MTGKLCGGRSWHLIGCDGLTGAGLVDGLEWLSKQLGPDWPRQRSAADESLV